MFESGRVRIVAIAALDSLVKHFALQERAINVVFISNLPVRVVDRLLNILHCVIFIETTAGSEAFTDHGSTRVTGRTGFNLSEVALRFQLGQTCAVMPVPENSLGIHDFFVQAAGAMARFATDINFGERRRETVGFQVEPFLQVRAMTLGTTDVPILSLSGPVERIVGFQFFENVWRLKIKPFLSNGVP